MHVERARCSCSIAAMCGKPLTRSLAAGPQWCAAEACTCGSVLSRLLSVKELCERMPQRERIRCMRCLYTMLLWATQRVAEGVCLRARTSLRQCRSGNNGLASRTVLVASSRCTAGLRPLHALISQRKRRCALCLRLLTAAVVRLNACVHGLASSHEGWCVVQCHQGRCMSTDMPRLSVRHCLSQ